MSGSRRLVLAAAISAATFVWSPTTIAQAADSGHRGTDAWVRVCDRDSCIGVERATSAFLDVAHGRYRGFTSPYIFAETDWRALLAISTARHDAIAAHQVRLTGELCSRSAKINTQAQLAAALEENAKSTRVLAARYGEELARVLSPEGRALLDREIDGRSDVIHTVDLDYATYLAAASIDPATYFESACSLPSIGQESGASAVATDDAKRAKPNALPLAVYVGQECPVSLELVRGSAEAAIARERIELLRWPTFQENGPWFGAYVAFECTEGRDWGLRLALIDSLDGSLVFYDGLIDGSDFYGLGRPHPRPVSYPSFVSDVVDRSVSRFLRARFELP